MRLTSREKEILELLKKEPMIAQEDLARYFGVTRSSIAVHISNLMKKGVILGKGYIFNEEVTVVVVGESTFYIRISGVDKNTRIDSEWGGFALKASSIFSALGINVRVITVLGNDEPGAMIINKLRDNKADISTVFRHPSKRTSRKVLVEQREVFKEGPETEDYIKAINIKDWAINSCQWLLVDPLLQELNLKNLLNKEEQNLPNTCTYRYMDSTSKIPGFLFDYDLLVLGVSDNLLIEHYQEQLDNKLENSKYCVITDGKSRIAYINGSTTGEFPILPNQGFSSREKLAYLLCGLVYGLSSGYALRQSIRIGVGAASTGEYY